MCKDQYMVIDDQDVFSTPKDLTLYNTTSSGE